MRERIKSVLLQAAALRQSLAQDQALVDKVNLAAQKLLAAVKQGGTVYACGNGGSACDAMHLTEELVARYQQTRPGIKAVHFGDTGTITCWANDFDFSSVYARQVQTYCTPKDVLVAFSTSGKSANILQAVHAAKAVPTFSIGLTGKGGGQLKDLCDLAIVVPSDDTARIQEIHITLVHIFCEALDNALA